MSVSAIESNNPILMPQDRVAPPGPVESAKADQQRLSMFAEDDGPSFWDFLDVINPLQHIPIVNTIYQDLTGDKIGVGARLAGGALFGGVIGLIASAADAVFEEATGDSVGGHVMAMFKDEQAPAAAVQAAAATPAQAAQAAAAMPMIAAADAPPIVATAAVQPQPPAPPPPGSVEFSPTGALMAPPPTTIVPPPVEPQKVAQPLKFMPVPGRMASMPDIAPPAVKVPVAGGSQRSNVPLVGHNPSAQVPSQVPAAVMAQQMAGAPPSPAAAARQGTPAPGSAGADWFSAAMMQGMDKYQRAQGLKDKPPAESSVH